MATKADLEKYLQNPNVQKMLDLISYTEGTTGNGYRTAFGGGRISSLDDHPRYLKEFTQTDGKKNKTSAAGRYQFIQPTWDSVAKRYGLEDFSPHNQDLAAVALLVNRGAIGPLLNGDFTTAVQKTGKEWASLPSSTYKQGKKSWAKVNKFLGGEIDIPTTAGTQDDADAPQIQAYQAPVISVPTAPLIPQISAPDAPQIQGADSLFNTDAIYTKSNKPTPVVQSNKGLAVPESLEEFNMFESIASADLAPDEEPAVVAVGEVLQRAREKQNSRSLMDSNPLTPIIGDIFDKVEV